MMPDTNVSSSPTCARAVLSFFFIKGKKASSEHAEELSKVIDI